MIEVAPLEPPPGASFLCSTTDLPLELVWPLKLKANHGPESFPAVGDLVVSYLHGKTSQVKADFFGQIGERFHPGLLCLEAVEVNLTDQASICEQVYLQTERIYWRQQAEDAAKNAAEALQKANEEAAKRVDEAQRQQVANLQKANAEVVRRIEEIQHKHTEALQKVTEETAKREEQQQAAFERIHGETARNQGALQDQVKALHGEKESLSRALASLKEGRTLAPRWVWAALAGAVFLGLLGGWLLGR